MYENKIEVSKVKLRNTTRINKKSRNNKYRNRKSKKVDN